MTWTWLWWFLIVVGVAAVAIGLIQAGRSDRGPSDRTEDGARPSPARQVLDERFVRGEIGEEEYWSRRRTLDEH